MRDKTSMTEQEKNMIRDNVTGGLPADMLVALFKMQGELDSFIMEQHQDNLPTNLKEWILRYTMALDSEIDEVRRVVGFKWWKENEDIDVEELHEEISDLWFFLISMTQRAGMTPHSIFKVYQQKLEENYARQHGQSIKGDDYDYRKGSN